VAELTRLYTLLFGNLDTLRVLSDLLKNTEVETLKDAIDRLWSKQQQGSHELQERLEASEAKASRFQTILAVWEEQHHISRSAQSNRMLMLLGLPSTCTT